MFVNNIGTELFQEHFVETTCIHYSNSDSDSPMCSRTINRCLLQLNHCLCYVGSSRSKNHSPIHWYYSSGLKNYLFFLTYTTELLHYTCLLTLVYQSAADLLKKQREQSILKMAMQGWQLNSPYIYCLSKSKMPQLDSLEYGQLLGSNGRDCSTTIPTFIFSSSTTYVQSRKKYATQIDHAQF